MMPCSRMSELSRGRTRDAPVVHVLPVFKAQGILTTCGNCRSGAPPDQFHCDPTTNDWSKRTGGGGGGGIPTMDEPQNDLHVGLIIWQQ